MVIELTNEPEYVTEAMIDREPPMGSAVWAKGEKPRYLKPMYEAFAEKWKTEQKKPGATRKEILPFSGRYAKPPGRTGAGAPARRTMECQMCTQFLI